MSSSILLGPNGNPLRPSRRSAGARKRAITLLLCSALIGLIIAVSFIFSIGQIKVSQPDAKPSAKIEQKAMVPCEPAESLRCRELRGEIPPEPEIKGLQIGFGQPSSGPSVIETFGWWTLAALILATLVAALTRWTIQQTAPIAIGVVVALLVLQNWWIFFAVVGALVLMLVAMAVRNLLAGGVRGARAAGVGNLLPQGMSLIVIWEIIQTLWSTGTVGAILNRAAGGQNPPAQNPNP